MRGRSSPRRRWRCGVGLLLGAGASGALWLPESATVLIADAHLGYGWAQRRRGELGPVADEAASGKVLALADELKPKQIVFLGDLVHAPKPAPGERTLVEGTLRTLATQAALTLVRGNHDRGFLRDFGAEELAVVPAWRQGGLLALHGDVIPAERAGIDYLVLGHFHPSLAIEDNAGARVRVPVFVHSERCLVLPAFSPYAAGWDLRRGLPPALQPLWKGTARRLIATSGKRLFPLSPPKAEKEASGFSVEDAAEQSS